MKYIFPVLIILAGLAWLVYLSGDKVKEMMVTVREGKNKEEKPVENETAKTSEVAQGPEA